MARGRASSASGRSARTRWSRRASCRLSGLPQRLLLLSYFEPDDVPNLLAQVGRARLPPDVPVYVGSYGANPGTGAQVTAMPSGRYAPMFALNEPWYRERRRLPPEYDPLVPKRLAGQVPPLNRLTSTSARVSWGAELGARYRDRLRAARDAGVTIDAWQFDEIVPSAARSSGVPLREFIRGVLRGLLFARPVLQDNPMQGFVWVAHSALGIALLPLTQELTTFWRTLNRAALLYVGEEYPRFEGNPRRVAQAQSVGQRALAAGGRERRALSRRYVPGMTPGYHLVAGLGGNVHQWSRPQVNSWRATYVDERARTGVAGFGEFDFRFGNSAPTVMHDVMSALAAAVGVGA